MKQLLLAASTAALALAIPAGAQASTMIELGTGPAGSVTTFANGSGVPVSGSTTVGQFTISATGIGQPPLTGVHLLDTSSIDVINIGATTSTVDVWVTETGLTGPTGKILFKSAFNNNALSDDTIAITGTTYLDKGNLPFGTLTKLNSVRLLPNDTKSAHKTARTGSGPYSITAEYIVTLAAGQEFDGTINITAKAKAPTPLPGAVWMFGGGLGLLGWALRRRKSLQATSMPQVA
jgi:hypothetical protein